MRSCLRRPLAPGRSRVRAILVSSVIFFSLSSAMVIVCHLREFLFRKEYAGEFLKGENCDCDVPPGHSGPGGTFQESLLCSATLGFGKRDGRRLNHGVSFI